MSSIQRVVSRWRANGLRLNPGATVEGIARLEELVGTRLPPDVCEFFGLADGMERSEVDEFLVNFWSVEAIAAQSVGHPRDPRDVPFADVSIGAYFVFLRCLGEGQVGVWVEAASLELPSLEAFFERYEADPDSIGLSEA